MITSNNLPNSSTGVGLAKQTSSNAVLTETAEVQMKPVASTLRALEVGESVTFPIEQRTTVMNTITRFRSEFARSAWDAVAETNKKEFSVLVTRIN